MGLDLKLLPQYSQNADFAHDILQFDRDSDMFELIAEVENQNGRQVPRQGIYSFNGNGEDGEPCYGKTIETPYGDVMNSVQSGMLKGVLAEYQTKYWRNKAVIAFLNELPDDLEIWLYWY